MKKKAGEWVEVVDRDIVLGDRVKIIKSISDCFINKSGDVIDHSTGGPFDYPLSRVEIDNGEKIWISDRHLRRLRFCIDVNKNRLPRGGAVG